MRLRHDLIGVSRARGQLCCAAQASGRSVPSPISSRSPRGRRPIPSCAAMCSTSSPTRRSRSAISAARIRRSRPCAAISLKCPHPGAPACRGLGPQAARTRRCRVYPGAHYRRAARTGDGRLTAAVLCELAGNPRSARIRQEQAVLVLRLFRLRRGVQRRLQHPGRRGAIHRLGPFGTRQVCFLHQHPVDRGARQPLIP